MKMFRKHILLSSLKKFETSSPDSSPHLGNIYLLISQLSVFILVLINAFLNVAFGLLFGTGLKHGDSMQLMEDE